MVSRPAASVLPENLWQMQIFSFWRESETPGLRSSHLYFNKPFRKFWDTMKFEDQRWNWQTAYIWLPRKEAKWGISLDADSNHLLKRNIPDGAGVRVSNSTQLEMVSDWLLKIYFMLFDSDQPQETMVWKLTKKVWNTSNLKLSWRLGKTAAGTSSSCWFAEALLWVPEVTKDPLCLGCGNDNWVKSLTNLPDHSTSSL